MKIPIAWIAAASCYAAVVPKLSFEQLVDTSDRIVHGRVERSWVAWDRAHRFIWTHYEIVVADAVKGGAAARVVVSEPGGTLDGITMAAPGVVRYSPGEEVVAFLHRTPIGYLRTNGYHQGKFRVGGGAVASTLKDRARRRMR